MLASSLESLQSRFSPRALFDLLAERTPPGAVAEKLSNVFGVLFTWQNLIEM